MAASPTPVWLTLAALSLAAPPLRAQPRCDAPVEQQAPAPDRNGWIDILMGNAQVAGELTAAGQGPLATQLLHRTVTEATARLGELAPADDPALAAIAGLSAAQDGVARIIAAATLADTLAPDSPAARLRRAIALLGRSARAYRSATGCGLVTDGATAAEARGALLRAEVLARDALPALAAQARAPASAIQATMAAVELLLAALPATPEAGAFATLDPYAYAALVEVARRAAAPLLR